MLKTVQRVATAALGVLAAPSPHVGAAGPFSFYAVEPCRVFDTRTGAQGGTLVTDTAEPPPPATPTGSSVTRRFEVRGRCGIPLEAEAVSFNLTMVAQPYTGHVALYPSGGTVPLTSTLNFTANQTVANGGVVPLNRAAPLDLGVKVLGGGAPTGARFSIVLDVTGYFAP